MYYYIVDTYGVVLNIILRTKGPEKRRFLAGYPRWISFDGLRFLYDCFANAYFTIETRQKPWQRHPSADKATPFSRSSTIIVSFE